MKIPRTFIGKKWPHDNQLDAPLLRVPRNWNTKKTYHHTIDKCNPSTADMSASHICNTKELFRERKDS